MTRKMLMTWGAAPLDVAVETMMMILLMVDEGSVRG